MTVEVVSLGCRLNLSESESLRRLLAGERDLVVVNSCAVTAEAVRQTRQAIRRARRARPHARLLVTGCAAEVERESLAAMPEVDGLIANPAKLDARAWNVPPAPGEPASTAHTRAYVAVRPAATMPAPSASSRRGAALPARSRWPRWWPKSSAMPGAARPKSC